MNNAILVAVVERTADLTRELARNTFPKPSMADDVVEHLAAADILEYHVIVVLVNDHLAHATDVRVVKEHGQRGLPKGPNLLRGVLRRLLGRRVGRRRSSGPVGGHAGQDFDRELGPRVTLPDRMGLQQGAAHLLARDVVVRELHLAHAARSQRFAQRVVSKYACPAP